MSWKPHCLEHCLDIYIVKVCRYNVTKSSLLSLRAIYFAATNLDLNSNETTRPLIGMGIPKRRVELCHKLSNERVRCFTSEGHRGAISYIPLQNVPSVNLTASYVNHSFHSAGF